MENKTIIKCLLLIILLGSVNTQASPGIDPTCSTFVIRPCFCSLNCGDVNSDRRINIVDALLIAQHYVGLNPVGFYKEAADVNCDRNINIIDALLVAQYYVGLIKKIPTVQREPIVTPEPKNPGDVWFHPYSGITHINDPNKEITLEIHANTGSNTLIGYSFLITYPSDKVLLNTLEGENGIIAGTDGFVSEVNNMGGGSLAISGLNKSGTGPGTDLHILTCYFKLALNKIDSAKICIKVIDLTTSGA